MSRVLSLSRELDNAVFRQRLGIAPGRAAGGGWAARKGPAILVPSFGNNPASWQLRLIRGAPTMTTQDEQRPVVYGRPPWPPYRDEIQRAIGEELRGHYPASQALPYRLLVVLMQLKEIDRKPPRQSGQKAPTRHRRKRGRSSISSV